jgi:hypothetical protein
LERSLSVNQHQGVLAKVEKVLTPQKFRLIPQNGSGRFQTQFAKLGLVVKMTLQADSSIFFHFESIEIDEK